MGLDIAKKRLSTLDDRPWDWGIYGEPGTRKSLVIRDILLSGMFEMDRVLMVDAERGDWTLGANIDCDVIYPIEIQMEKGDAYPWITFKKIVAELVKAGRDSRAKTPKPFPYDLIIFEGMSLVGLWCDDQVVSENTNADMSTLPDHRKVRSRMVSEMYKIKWLPCNKIVTARERNDASVISGEGSLITGGDKYSPNFIPSVSKEFLAIWDIVSRFTVQGSSRGGKLVILCDHDNKSVQKDRFGTMPNKIQYTKVDDILPHINLDWREKLAKAEEESQSSVPKLAS